jgi:oxygen-dependent protoporphyrinogen oxidase
MSASVETLVVGAGISGLAFAHARAGHGEVLVLESTARAGGLVRTEHLGTSRDLRCELGPEALRAEPGELRRLLDELGLTADAPPANASKRFITLRGVPVEVPLAPLELLTTPLLSLGGKLRLTSEVWRDPKLALDGSIADFVRHRLGREALDALIDPLVSGIHGGDAEKLSLRACFPRLVELVEQHGSLIRALRASGGGPAPGVIKVRGGNQQLVDALAAALGDKLRLAAPVRAIAREDGGWRVMTASETYVARHLVLAVPATTAARLLSTVAPELARAIGSIASENLVAVHHAYRRADVAHALDGFGYLVPARERQFQLGTLFSSSSDPTAAPHDHVLLRTLIGGARHPEVVDFDDARLLEIVAREVGQALGLRAPPSWSHVDRYRAVLPRFELGHPERVDAIFSALPPGLNLLGNYLRGIGENHLVSAARQLANPTFANAGR